MLRFLIVLFCLQAFADGPKKTAPPADAPQEQTPSSNSNTAPPGTENFRMDPGEFLKNPPAGWLPGETQTFVNTLRSLNPDGLVPGDQATALVSSIDRAFNPPGGQPLPPQERISLLLMTRELAQGGPNAGANPLGLGILPTLGIPGIPVTAAFNLTTIYKPGSQHQAQQLLTDLRTQAGTAPQQPDQTTRAPETGNRSEVSPIGQGTLTGILAPQPPRELAAPRAIIERDLAENPQHLEANRHAAVQDAHRGNDKAAFPRFKTAIEQGASDPRTLTMAGLSAYNTGNFEEAEAWAGKAFRDDPTAPLAREAEAVQKLAKSRIDTVKDPFLKRTEASSDEADPFGTALPRHAAKSRRTAVATPVAQSYLTEGASAALRDKDFVRAAQLSGKALEADPDDVRALAMRANADLRLGKAQDALGHAKHGLDLAYGFLPLMLAKGRALALLGDYKGARDEALAILRAAPESRGGLRLLAFAQSRLGDRAALVAALERAQAVDPESAEILAKLRLMPEEADASVLFTNSYALGDSKSPKPGEHANAAGGKRVLWVGLGLGLLLMAAGFVMVLSRREGRGLSTTAREMLMGRDDR